MENVGIPFPSPRLFYGCRTKKDLVGHLLVVSDCRGCRGLLSPPAGCRYLLRRRSFLRLLGGFLSFLSLIHGSVIVGRNRGTTSSEVEILDLELDFAPVLFGLLVFPLIQSQVALNHNLLPLGHELREPLGPLAPDARVDEEDLVPLLSVGHEGPVGGQPEI